jgi:hypothetical protein
MHTASVYMKATGELKLAKWYLIVEGAASAANCLQAYTAVRG